MRTKHKLYTTIVKNRKKKNKKKKSGTINQLDDVLFKQTIFRFIASLQPDHPKIN